MADGGESVQVACLRRLTWRRQRNPVCDTCLAPQHAGAAVPLLFHGCVQRTGRLPCGMRKALARNHVGDLGSFRNNHSALRACTERRWRSHGQRKLIVRCIFRGSATPACRCKVYQRLAGQLPLPLPLLLSCSLALLLHLWKTCAATAPAPSSPMSSRIRSTTPSWTTPACSLFLGRMWLSL